jgi:hypothetical protein
MGLRLGIITSEKPFDSVGLAHQGQQHWKHHIQIQQGLNMMISRTSTE